MKKSAVGLMAAASVAASLSLVQSVWAHLPPRGKTVPRPRVVQPATPGVDPRTVALMSQVVAATRAAHTMTADFVYTVTSVKRQQYVSGSLAMMKPNFARLHFTNMARPGFPSLVDSDGKTVYSFTPTGYRPHHSFPDGPFDSVAGARAASGEIADGGVIGTDLADPTGANVHLWDAAPLNAFFDPQRAIERWVYTEPQSMRYEGEQTLNGITYRVLETHLNGGNIEDGEITDFEQHLYIGADNLIHGYQIEFKCGGRPAVQLAWLKNVKVNVPMTESDFAFTTPAK